MVDTIFISLFWKNWWASLVAVAWTKSITNFKTNIYIYILRTFINSRAHTNENPVTSLYYIFSWPFFCVINTFWQRCWPRGASQSVEANLSHRIGAHFKGWVQNHMRVAIPCKKPVLSRCFPFCDFTRLCIHNVRGTTYRSFVDYTHACTCMWNKKICIRYASELFLFGIHRR